jgi:hypothetical protein
VDGERFASWVGDHPIQWGLASALLGFVIGIGFSGSLRVGGALGLALGFFNWWSWRPGGPAIIGDPHRSAASRGDDSTVGSIQPRLPWQP